MFNHFNCHSAIKVQNKNKIQLILCSMDADRKELEPPWSVVSKGGPGSIHPQMPRDQSTLLFFFFPHYILKCSEK